MIVGVPNQTRLLYHYALRESVSGLLAAAVLPLDEHQLPRRLARLGRRPPRVVWLSDLGELAPEQLRGAATVRPGVVATAERLVRVTLSVRDAQYWDQWARKHAIGRRAQRVIDDAAAGLSGRWWVLTRPVPISDWLQIDAVTGERLWPPDGEPAHLPHLAAHRAVRQPAT
jgi:hypothetical protein